MAGFKAIELDAVSRQRTGREVVLDAATRAQAIAELLRQLEVAPERAHIDPSRTLVQVDSALWTLVAVAAPAAIDDSPAMRRAGAKHKRVR
jgi:hypothetical protein